MKKRIVIFVLTVLLCFAFSGCQAETGETKKLWVVTDLGYDWSWGGELEMNEDRAKMDFQAMRDYFGGLPEDLEVELEVLPVNDTDLNARLTRLKTEILAGGGPDVFLLGCNYPGGGFLNRERVFPNPEKAMYAGFFLPLDEYIENARFMEWDKFTPVVMEAGRSEEGQILLPLRYNTNVLVAKKEDLGEKVPENWDEAVEGDNPVYRKGYGWAAYNDLPGVFPRVIDNKTEELLITKEELLHRIEQGLTCPSPFADIRAEFSTLVPSQKSWVVDVWGEYNLWETDLENNVFLPLRNTEGGYTAHVTIYGAVNRNTDFPQEAFTVLDMLFSKEMQRGEAVGNMYGHGPFNLIYLFSNMSGVPVHEDLYNDKDNSVDRLTYVTEEAFQKFDKVRKEITDVYFPTDMESEIGDMYWEFFYNEVIKGEERSKNLEQAVSETYDRIWMMLGES